MQQDSDKKIFILGDSRTGTMTLHRYLKGAGYRSVHYFFKESGVSEPAHLEYAENWKKLKAFINSGEFNAFSDYPLRTFYKDLLREYKDQYFILSFRKDVETWRKSMEGFFSKFNIEISIDDLTVSYKRLNDEIREICTENNIKLCEICIDDSSEENGAKLSEFLDLGEVVALGHENSTASYDNSLWSTRINLYNTSSTKFYDYVKNLTHPNKAMISEFGWIYLINDTSDFMDYLYGDRSWGDAEISNAKRLLSERRETLKDENIVYLKFAIPEKATVYPEYLPKIFGNAEPRLERPAVQLLSDEALPFSYPLELLKDVKSNGFLYFRGDSHTNWLGAYFVYHHIISSFNEQVKEQGLQDIKVKAPLKIKELSVGLAAYGGDLFVQLDPEAKSYFNGAWSDISLDGKIEYLPRFWLNDEQQTSKKVEVEEDLTSRLGERETIRKVNPNKSLPKAVVFRDSTSDYITDLLAEHFSEVLFIWHKGRVYKDVIEKEKPDVVLHIMAERFLVQYAQEKEAFHYIFESK